MARGEDWGPSRPWGDKEYLKYGGLAFTANVPPQQINAFVDDLPEYARDSMYSVVRQLSEAGLITLHHGDFSSVDDDMVEAAMEARVDGPVDDEG